MSTTPNEALAALLDDVAGVLDLDGSRRCILQGAIVEHLKPFMAGTQAEDTKLMDYLQSIPPHAPIKQFLGGRLSAAEDVRVAIRKTMENPPKDLV